MISLKSSRAEISFSSLNRINPRRYSDSAVLSSVCAGEARKSEKTKRGIINIRLYFILFNCIFLLLPLFDLSLLHIAVFCFFCLFLAFSGILKLYLSSQIIIAKILGINIFEAFFQIHRGHWLGIVPGFNRVGREFDHRVVKVFGYIDRRLHLQRHGNRI